VRISFGLLLREPDVPRPSQISFLTLLISIVWTSPARALRKSFSSSPLLFLSDGGLPAQSKLPFALKGFEVFISEFDPLDGAILVRFVL